MTQLELQRRLRGLKQIDLAREIGLSSEYISGVERGWVKPSQNFKQKCVKAFQLPENVLFQDIGKNGNK